MGLNAIMAVAAGAAAGAWLRWVLGMMLNPLFPTIPLGTLAANLAGGYLMGLAMTYFMGHGHIPAEWRLMIMTGFLGALTTFSTFSAEMVTLFSRQQLSWAFGAIFLHVAGSLTMTALGILTMKWLRH